MSAPPSGFAPRPASFRRYRALALAATILPGATLPLLAAAKHKPASAPLTHARTAQTHHPAELAHTALNSARRQKQAVPAHPPRRAIYRNPAPLIDDTPVRHTPAPRATEDVAADRAVQDRVHNWIRSRTAPEQAATKPETSAPALKAVRAAKPAVALAPDLSPAPHKATIDDFDRAARQQTQTVRAIAAQNQTRTTAEDDAAALAESHIPSTAPTARVAAPFTHGELLGSATSADFTAKQADFAAQPATLTAKTPDAAVLKRPDTRSDAAALANTTTATDAGTSAAPLRSIAAQAATSTTPRLVLAKPAAIVRQAPAASAVLAAAKHPTLDPAVAAGMTDETFDDDAPVPTAATAISLAGKAAKSDLTPRPALAPLASDDDPDMRSTGKMARVDLYDNRGHLRLIPPMKGTHEILVHQNQMAVADGLDRIEDDDQLYDMRRLKLLVSLPDNNAIQVNDDLPANRRYARPWSVRFLNDLARAHYARFHTPLTITSAVRTIAFQRRLVMTNGNAAPPTGEVASPHLYGQAIDLGKHGMSVTEIAWMRAYLTPIENEGKIDVEEEFQQACFHISVYRRYLGLPARRNTPQPESAPSRTLLQVKTTQAPTPARHRRHLGALLATGLR